MEDDKDLANESTRGSETEVRGGDRARRCGCKTVLDPSSFYGAGVMSIRGDIRYCSLHGAAAELLDACIFVKAFLGKLEGGLDFADPLTALRDKFHAPLHAKLDAAITKAEGISTAHPNTSTVATLQPKPKG